ncbi:MAG: protein NO VEIN domain-containing protein [Thermoleophilaceae bacterium]
MTGPRANPNQQLEDIAVEFVIAQEREHGRNARDSRGRGAGDVESDDRVIEIKAFSGRWRTGLLYFTPPQLEHGERDPNYHVYVVENIAQGDPAKFELSILHGEDLRRLFASAQVHRLFVPIRAADRARFLRLDGTPVGGQGRDTRPRVDRDRGPEPHWVQADSVRGMVIAAWQTAGSPEWDLDRTIAAAEEADDALEQQELDPAPTFRSHRRRGDHAAVKGWVQGCRFPWLASTAKF